MGTSLALHPSWSRVAKEGLHDQEDGQGYVLHSKDGSRKLGGPYRTRAEALKRERQVQFFKHKKSGG